MGCGRRPPLPILRGRAGVGAVEITTTLIRAIARRKTGVFDALWRHFLPQGREKGTTFAVGVDFPREVPYHCGSARFKGSPNRRHSRDIGTTRRFFGMHGRTLLPGKPMEPSQTPDYTINRADASEVFSDRFVTRLRALNDFVRGAEEVIEGGIFYWDHDADFFDKMPDPSFAPARRNLWRATRFKKNLLEIGVNAGHSALLSLSANDNLIYHGVDIGSHRYTDPCVNYLAREFPGRMRFYPGNSREVLPYLATHRQRVGVRHISRRWRPYGRALPHRHLQLHSARGRRIRQASVAGRHQRELDIRRLLRICVAGPSVDGNAVRGLGGRQSQRPRPDLVMPAPVFATFWHGPFNPTVYSCAASFPACGAGLRVYTLRVQPRRAQRRRSRGRALDLSGRVAVASLPQRGEAVGGDVFHRFRYSMIRQTGCCWVDADILCLTSWISGPTRSYSAARRKLTGRR